jgi:hypothetical protein
MTKTLRRRFLFNFGILGIGYSGAACGKGFFSMKRHISVDAFVFNYLNRPIFDVYLNNIYVGGSASLSDSPFGQFGNVAGTNVSNGPQVLTWRVDGPPGMPGNGEKFSAVNPLNVSIEKLPPDTGALAIHIYPDNTAELVFSEITVAQTVRGLSYAKKYQKNGK